MSLVVSFDYGQTLAELDAELLAARVAERQARVDPRAIRAATSLAWQSYNRAKRDGASGRDAWCCLMERWLLEAGIQSIAQPAQGAEPLARGLSEWLWSEQPRKNLWRQPISGMLELVSELGQRGVPLAIVSNSEGHLRELVEELGQASYFAAVVDSGKLDFEKPDRRMFELAAQQLNSTVAELIHIGDAWEADVVGAIGAGARAIWFASSQERKLPSGVKACSDAEQVRAALLEFGVPLAAVSGGRG
ncbi:MAG TPA: HAD family hydrolase [Polyangiaceae bacterium]|jgi:putative hydrolase of the HAD superfamily|nr:HAD family hydrolase [Polyangiaceae bacterium]